jgi:hypothetical protein
VNGAQPPDGGGDLAAAIERRTRRWRGGGVRDRLPVGAELERCARPAGWSAKC